MYEQILVVALAGMERENHFILGPYRRGSGYRDSIMFIRGKRARYIVLYPTDESGVSRTVSIPVLPPMDGCPQPGFYDLYYEYESVISGYRIEHFSTYLAGFKVLENDPGPNKKHRWYYFSDMLRHFVSEENCILIELPYTSSYLVFLGLDRLQNLRFNQAILCDAVKYIGQVTEQRKGALGRDERLRQSLGIFTFMVPESARSNRFYNNFHWFSRHPVSYSNWMVLTEGNYSKMCKDILAYYLDNRYIMRIFFFLSEYDFPRDPGDERLVRPEIQNMMNVYFTITYMGLLKEMTRKSIDSMKPKPPQSKQDQWLREAKLLGEPSSGAQHGKQKATSSTRGAGSKPNPGKRSVRSLERASAKLVHRRLVHRRLE
ncbi:hypothetical protein Tsubulata_006610 [Turnera subulata]|uniref:Uncharacterized protein n=1 Tax=Turnera subulata TaxID=218843 RepID=A0A9Q0FFI4_9ROSI|nr:hypothetical protein Tsubulata_006610 [Turnera subulata]